MSKIQSKYKIVRKSFSLTRKSFDRYLPALFIGMCLVLWQGASFAGLTPQYVLPSPLEILQALGEDAQLLAEHAQATLVEAFLGLALGVVFGSALAFVMEFSHVVHRIVHPLLIVSQTIPTIAVAPLLILWFGYGIFPKILLVALTTFFPITISLIDGFSQVSDQYVSLLKTMKATKLQVFRYVSLPFSYPYFFSGLKISVTYALVAAVIAEWLGGSLGLGVYMTRVRKSFMYDKMFAVIVVISVLSLVAIWLIKLADKKVNKAQRRKETKDV